MPRGNVATSADRREVLGWAKSDKVCREGDEVGVGGTL